MDQTAVEGALGQVVDPELLHPLAELDMVRSVDVDGSAVTALVGLPTPTYPYESELEQRIRTAILGLDSDVAVQVSFVAFSDEERVALATKLKGNRGESREVTLGAAGSRTRVIGVSSGKGGVGKSSVTANLAVALAATGKRVGIIDADVWGFSIPKMMGIDRPPSVLDDMLVPPNAYGVGVISMDFFVQPDQAVVWRGPMLHKALEQFLVDVYWGDLDYLLIDMPPGTGDVAISISQYLPRSEIVVVTTPQPTAQRVAARAGLMARKVNQDIIGVIENMSWFTGDDGKRYEIFGSGGGQDLAEQLDVDFLGSVPLVPALREGADEGRPIVATEPDSEAAHAFTKIAAELVERGPRLRTHPELVIS